MEIVFGLLRQPLVWLVLLWLAAYQLAYFALWLPYRRRSGWVDGTVTVTEAVPVSRTMRGAETPGQALYQLRGTLHTPQGPVEAGSVEQVKAASADVVGQTLPCRYDPAEPRLMTLVPASAPILGSGLGLVVLLVVVALVAVPAVVVLRDLGVL